MKGKIETGDVGIWQVRARKIIFLYQIELRFTIFPNLWKNATIFPNPTGAGTSPEKGEKSLGQ